MQIRKPPQKDSLDSQLHSAVLLANGKVHEAFQYQRLRSNRGLANNNTNNLSEFFAKAEKLGKLDSILQLTLTMGEERALVNFLNDRDAHAGQRKEILLMFYLQRSRFVEAVALSQRLDASGVGGDKARHTRQAIMSR